MFGLLAVGTYNYGKEMLHRESLGINQHRRPTGYLEIQVGNHSNKNYFNHNDQNTSFNNNNNNDNHNNQMIITRL